METLGCISTVREYGSTVREHGVYETHSRLPTHGEPPHILGGYLVLGLRALQRARALRIRSEAAGLARLHARTAHRQLGFARFGDFAREVLQTPPRTARRRVLLDTALRQSPALSAAFEAGELTPCLALELRPVLGSPAERFWLELARSLSVRELRRRIREAVLAAPGMGVSEDTAGGVPEAASEAAPEAASEDEYDSEDALTAGRRVIFSAPLSAAIAWDQGIETARRVLGRDAPAGDCVEAILAEANVLGHDAGRKGSRGSGTALGLEGTSGPEGSPEPADGPTSRGAKPGPPRDPRTLDRSRQTLAAVQRSVASLQQLTRRDDADPTIAETIARLLEIQKQDRPLRTLQGRLLRDLHASGLVFELGQASLMDFVQTVLGISERTARNLLSEAFLFDDEPLLEQAFASGGIGLGQAHCIHRIALGRTLPAFIRRAGEVTHTQFERETVFLERLAEFAPSIAPRFRGPFPMPGVESALVRRLHERGRSLKDIRLELQERGIAVPPGWNPTQGPDPPDGGQGAAGQSVTGQAATESCDPAVNPPLLRRLEALLQALALGEPADEDGRQTLAGGDRWTTISFRLSDPVREWWEASIRIVQDRCRNTGSGPPISTWAAAILILERAVREWLRQDPARVPTEARILARDDYRCQAPGCSARRGLEVHHVRFRSQGGSGHHWNKITLCHVHHHHVLHAGFLTVRGKAPGALAWKLGNGCRTRWFLGWRKAHVHASGVATVVSRPNGPETRSFARRGTLP
jgi:hypothetical protein